MAWPESLNASDQLAITDFAKDIAIFATLLGQACTIGEKISAKWGGGLSTLVGGLTTGDIIPNTTGLQGSQPLTKADLTNLAGYAISISDPANASQGTGGYNGGFIAALYVKAAGINASIGK